MVMVTSLILDQWDLHQISCHLLLKILHLIFLLHSKNIYTRNRCCPKFHICFIYSHNFILTFTFFSFIFSLFFPVGVWMCLPKHACIWRGGRVWRRCETHKIRLNYQHNDVASFNGCFVQVWRACVFFLNFFLNLKTSMRRMRMEMIQSDAKNEFLFPF